MDLQVYINRVERLPFSALYESHKKYNKDITYNEALTVPLWDLVLHYAFDDKTLTEKNKHDLIRFINVSTTNIYIHKEVFNVIDYLTQIELLATPLAVQQAKKSKRSYIEYLIYKNQHSGTITNVEAEQLNMFLTEFLNNKIAINM